MNTHLIVLCGAVVNKAAFNILIRLLVDICTHFLYLLQCLVSNHGVDGYLEPPHISSLGLLVKFFKYFMIVK